MLTISNGHAQTKWGDGTLSGDVDANGLKINSTTYYASGYGMVKQVIKVGTTTTTVELQKFEAGKK